MTCNICKKPIILGTGKFSCMCDGGKRNWSQRFEDYFSEMYTLTEIEKDIIKQFITTLLAEQRSDIVEVNLNSKQCAEVALFMYKKYIEEMRKPRFAIPTFPNWLDELLT